MKYQLENTDEWLVGVHERATCRGWTCTIHKKTDHHMRSWPQHWRPDRHLMERICPHGIGHPDPDELLLGSGKGVHGCDGCCRPPGEGNDQKSD